MFDYLLCYVMLFIIYCYCYQLIMLIYYVKLPILFALLIHLKVLQNCGINSFYMYYVYVMLWNT
jgi:hypothetical protein